MHFPFTGKAANAEITVDSLMMPLYKAASPEQSIRTQLSPQNCSISESLLSQCELYKNLEGKRIGLVVLSAYPFDPRPRRTADALMRHGMSVDYVCVADGKVPWHEKTN